MDSKEVIQAFQAFLEDITQDKAAFALEVTTLLKEEVRNRVQNTGVNSEGSLFAPYTPNYAKQRSKDGYQIRKVDYTRTGQLWGNVIVKIEAENEDSVTTGFGPRTEENILKVRGKGALTPRKDGVKRGLILQPSEEELAFAFDTWKNGIIEKFTKRLR